jgi:transglutaminase-like putative cysteine protease
VGFGPGERNPFTGYWDVRESDAHAWVEVWYPHVGWVPYDPTFGVPPADPSFGSRFVLGDALRAAGRFFREHTPRWVLGAAGSVRSEIAAALANRWAVVAVLLVLGLGWALQRRGGRRWSFGRPRARPPVGAAAAFAALERTLAQAGRVRPANETPSEFLADLGRDPGLDPDVASEAEVVVRAFERERFSTAPPDGEGIREAERAAEHVRALVASR